MPKARSARTPPMPSTAYCASRIARLLSYRREVTQRPIWLFSGRSVSSRYSGTRPTSTRQTCATTSSSFTGTRHRQRLAVGPGHLDARQAVRVGVEPVLMLEAGDVDALVEVAGAVHQAHADHRQRQVGGLLQDVAGQDAQPAGIDRQRAVHAELGAAEGHRMLGAGSAGAPGPFAVGAQLLRQAHDARHQGGIASRTPQRRLRRLGEQPARIAATTQPNAPGRWRPRWRGRRPPSTSGSRMPRLPAHARARAVQRPARPPRVRCLCLPGTCSSFGQSKLRTPGRTLGGARMPTIGRAEAAQLELAQASPLEGRNGLY